jgi:hypothetical protein
MKRTIIAALAGTVLTLAVSALAFAQTSPQAPGPITAPTPAPAATPVSIPSSLPPTGPLTTPMP